MMSESTGIGGIRFVQILQTQTGLNVSLFPAIPTWATSLITCFRRATRAVATMARITRAVCPAPATTARSPTGETHCRTSMMTSPTLSGPVMRPPWTKTQIQKSQLLRQPKLPTPAKRITVSFYYEYCIHLITCIPLLWRRSALYKLTNYPRITNSLHRICDWV